MSRVLYLMPCLLLGVLFLGSVPKTPQAPPNARPLYFPPKNTGDWEQVSPLALNLDEQEIDKLSSFLEENQTKSFLLLKDGKIVLEKYYGWHKPYTWHTWNSAGKSLMATMLGLAQDEGLLNIQDKTSDYLGRGWTSLTPEQEAKITLWHHLTMTGGLKNNIWTFNCVTPKCLLYKTEAGKEWSYHNSLYILLKDVLEKASETEINDFMRSRLLDKIGMRGGWTQSFNRIIFKSSARDMARFGLLILNKGVWDGKPVLRDSSYYQAMVSPSQDLNPAYGYMWWLNGQFSFKNPNNHQTVEASIAPDGPADLISASGAKGQFISISPSQGLILVRQGGFAGKNLAVLDFHNEIWRQLKEMMAE